MVTVSQGVLQRLKLISEMTRKWDAADPAKMPIEERIQLSMMVAGTFRRFEDFAIVGMKFLGFDTTAMQLDIAAFMADKSIRKKMVAAQRGEAKSTLAALYAVWSLIQDPSYRVLIVSAGEDQASDVAILCVRLIMQWHLLCYLRPDSTAGDRTANTKFDVHHHLKPVDKSASVTCVGITSNLPGKRADLLIPDDVESPINSATQVMRDTLLERTKEFAAICTHGETLYLGTPQTKDSIYKSLPSRGFVVRIWTGRYPTPEETLRYGAGTLAPFILEAIEADPSLQTGGGLSGKMGKPADPQRFDEDALQEKELDYGPEGFALQFMLDTTLSDAQRTRLQVSDLIVAHYNHESVPEVIHYSKEPRYRILEPMANLTGLSLYCPAASSADYVPYKHKLMVIDPAGNGGDEVSYCAGGSTQGYIHVFSAGGLRGGMTEQNMDTLLDYCVEFGISDVKVESNMGHGTVTSLLLQQIEKRKAKDATHPNIGVEDYYSIGQKEKRIIDTIGPVMRRHKLVVHWRAIQDDQHWCEQHPRNMQTVTSLLYQIANITYDRGSLSKDDRADSLQGLVRFLSELLVVDDEKASTERKRLVEQEFIDNPMGYDGAPKRKGISARIQRYRR